MRLTGFLLLLPLGVLAQTPAPTPKPSTPTQTAKPAEPTAKPATPGAKPTAAATPQSATRKPTPATSPAARLVTDDQKTLYAVGLATHRSLAALDLTTAELEIVKRGITDAAARKPAVDLDEWGPKIAPMARARRDRSAAREKEASAAYLAKAATETGAVKTESGLIFRQLTSGTGATPTADDTVRVHYRGTLINGTEFDSSYERKEPAEFRLSGVIPCWTEGVQRIKVGGKARLVCPSEIAYGEVGSGPIPGNAALIFEVELLEIVK